MYWRSVRVSLSILLLVAGPLAAQRGGGTGRGGGAGAGAGTGGGFGGPTPQPVGIGRGSSDAPFPRQGRGFDNRPADLPVKQVTDNRGLSAELQKWLPPGQNLREAAAGFENQGQFVAALHVAHNLKIPLDQLKTEMTGSDRLSLGKAIQKLRPAIDGKTVKDNVKLAERQTERDFDQAEAIASGRQNRIALHVASDSKRAERLTAMLPPGTTLDTASTGFKNQGQFIASLEVSKKLGIPFAEIKDRVTAGQSLGDALHDLNPELGQDRIQAAVKQAEQNAKQPQ